jgi:hypothetical protein
MATKEIHTKEAKAIFDLYQVMPENIKKEIRELIMPAPHPQSHESDELSALSNESFGEIWNDPANDHWDQFFKTH